MSLHEPWCTTAHRGCTFIETDSPKAPISSQKDPVYGRRAPHLANFRFVKVKDTGEHVLQREERTEVEITAAVVAVVQQVVVMLWQ